MLLTGFKLGSWNVKSNALPIESPRLFNLCTHTHTYTHARTHTYKQTHNRFMQNCFYFCNWQLQNKKKCPSAKFIVDEYGYWCLQSVIYMHHEHSNAFSNLICFVQLWNTVTVNQTTGTWHWTHLSASFTYDSNSCKHPDRRQDKATTGVQYLCCKL